MWNIQLKRTIIPQGKFLYWCGTSNWRGQSPLRGSFFIDVEHPIEEDNYPSGEVSLLMWNIQLKRTIIPQGKFLYWCGTSNWRGQSPLRGSFFIDVEHPIEEDNYPSGEVSLLMWNIQLKRTIIPQGKFLYWCGTSNWRGQLSLRGSFFIDVEHPIEEDNYPSGEVSLLMWNIQLKRTIIPQGKFLYWCGTSNWRGQLSLRGSFFIDVEHPIEEDNYPSGEVSLLMWNIQLKRTIIRQGKFLYWCGTSNWRGQLSLRGSFFIDVEHPIEEDNYPSGEVSLLMWNIQLKRTIIPQGKFLYWCGTSNWRGQLSLRGSFFIDVEHPIEEDNHPSGEVSLLMWNIQLKRTIIPQGKFLYWCGTSNWRGQLSLRGSFFIDVEHPIEEDNYPSGEVSLLMWNIQLKRTIIPQGKFLYWCGTSNWRGQSSLRGSFFIDVEHPIEEDNHPSGEVSLLMWNIQLKRTIIPQGKFLYWCGTSNWRGQLSVRGSFFIDVEHPIEEDNYPSGEVSLLMWNIQLKRTIIPQGKFLY